MLDLSGNSLIQVAEIRWIWRESGVGWGIMGIWSTNEEKYGGMSSFVAPPMSALDCRQLELQGLRSTYHRRIPLIS